MYLAHTLDRHISHTQVYLDRQDAAQECVDHLVEAIEATDDPAARSACESVIRRRHLDDALRGLQDLAGNVYGIAEWAEVLPQALR